MNLQKASNEAMAYLDSVGVAAEWFITTHYLEISTDRHFFWSNNANYSDLINKIKEHYPQKSPA